MSKQLKNKTLALIVGLVMALALEGRAQSGNWDPYVHSVSISPAPLLPVEFNGTGVCSLKPGNDGETDLPLGNPDGTNAFDRMVVTISLANGVPNVSDPSDATLALTALGGPGKDYWDWTYLPEVRTFRGVQSQIIPGYTADEVTIQYKVAENTFRSADPGTYNGLNVNISPPGYTNPQKTDNDQAAQYAYVEAMDFGDAPISYGAAVHEIALAKTEEGFYNQYMYLGNRVDPETNYQASAHADGDDTNQTGGLNVDDEDGVTFPALIPGTTVTIPVVLTIVDGDETGSGGNLSAWFDWNGDGDFSDSGERVTSDMYVNYGVLGGGSTGTVNLQVTVPSGATVGTTFARFRFGAPLLGTTAAYRSAAYGEVEDYEITIKGASIGDRVWEDVNGNGIQDAGEPALTNVTMKLYNSVSNVVATTVSDVDGHYSFDGLQPGTYFVQALSPTNTIPTPAIAGNDTDVDSNGNAAGWSGPVTVVAGETRSDIDFGFYRPARLFGYAYRDTDSSLTRNAGDGSASGMVVQGWRNGLKIASTNANAEGYYTFDNLVAGTYEVRFISNVDALTDIPTSGDAATDIERNRAAPTAQGYATVTYSIAAGHGIGENIGEPINAGFRGTGPMSSGIDLRAYQGADGVYVEFVAYDVEEDGMIRLYLLAADGNVVWSGVVEVKAGPRYICRFLVPGLVLGETYSFKVRDEVGKIWLAPSVTVKPFAAEMVKMSLAGITLAFESLPERDYEIQWTARLGSAWRTVTNVPSQGERTSVLVVHPDPTSPSGFFRIRMK